MRGWHSLASLAPWKKLGYTLEVESHGDYLFTVLAWAPRCSHHRLDLLISDGRVIAVTLVRAPLTRRHKIWREEIRARGVDWSTIPAAWFAKKLETILKQQEVA